MKAKSTAAVSKMIDKVRATRIASAITDCADHRGAVLTMRERLLSEYKGCGRSPLDKESADLVRDAIETNLRARKTISEKSVGPMTSTAAKIAAYMPCMLALEARDFAKVSDSYAALAKFATAVKRAEGDARSALAEATKPKRKNYKKAAAAHFKALLGMNDGKFFTPKQRGAIVEAAGICGIEIA